MFVLEVVVKWAFSKCDLETSMTLLIYLDDYFLH